MSIPMRTTTVSNVRFKYPGWRRKGCYTAWAFAAPALILLLIFWSSLSLSPFTTRSPMHGWFQDPCTRIS